MMKLFLLFLVIPFIKGNRIVITRNGPIKGTSLATKRVMAFLGIPYAEPPVGTLRFAKPVQKSSWKKIYKANELPPTCVQERFERFYFFPDPDERMSEDCLYLNLWVPEGGSCLKPIMVFIHGGGFMTGSTNMKIYDGSTLSEHGDVIVATINYRVGTLGFFSGFIDEAPGNMGLYDQIMAIQWIKDNAKRFGGDPDNIVLMGESAGGVSISMHMISPLSKNLFRRAILQSGSAFSPLYNNRNEVILTMSQTIANLLGCTEDNESLRKNAKVVVDCMKKLPMQNISVTDGIFMRNGGTLYPRVGDEFLPENIINSFREGNFKDTDLLLGVNQDEGTLLLILQRGQQLGRFGENAESVEFNDTSAREYLQSILEMNDEESNNIFQGYFDRVKEESGYTYLNAISEVIGDFAITCSAVFEADFRSLKNNPVYFYMFDYRPASTPYAEWMGVTHFDELQYVFGNPVYKNFTEYEKEVSGYMMDLWAAFAKEGNPTIPGGMEWPRYSYKIPKYFVIGKRDRVGISPDNYRCRAWRNIFHSVIDDETVHRG